MNHIIDFQKQHNLNPTGNIDKDTLLKIKEVNGIKTNEALAHFMGQCAVESNEFTAVEENLNYSAQGLLNTFKKYFTPDTANQYARQPIKIANHVYANRMGNGNEASGDGYKHRGFGFLQITGKDNQNKFSDYIKDPKIKDYPNLIAEQYAFESAKYFFDTNHIWNYCNKVDVDSITKVSKIINLGNVNSKSTPNGLQDRINKTLYYWKLINN